MIEGQGNRMLWDESPDEEQAGGPSMGSGDWG